MWTKQSSNTPGKLNWASFSGPSGGKTIKLLKSWCNWHVWIKENTVSGAPWAEEEAWEVNLERWQQSDEIKPGESELEFGILFQTWRATITSMSDINKVAILQCSPMPKWKLGDRKAVWLKISEKASESYRDSVLWNNLGILKTSP